MSISWHLLLFLCCADTNPFKCKSPQGFSRKLSSRGCFSWWRVTLAQIDVCRVCNVFPIFQDNPSMWPHGWWQTLPHNHHSHICKWPQDKLNGPKHPLSAVDDLFITTIFYLYLAFKDEPHCLADFSCLCSSNVSQDATGHWTFTGSVILTDDGSLRPHPRGAQMSYRVVAWCGIKSFDFEIWSHVRPQHQGWRILTCIFSF